MLKINEKPLAVGLAKTQTPIHMEPPEACDIIRVMACPPNVALVGTVGEDGFAK